MSPGTLYAMGGRTSFKTYFGTARRQASPTERRGCPPRAAPFVSLKGGPAAAQGTSMRSRRSRPEKSL